MPPRRSSPAHAILAVRADLARPDPRCRLDLCHRCLVCAADSWIRTVRLRRAHAGAILQPPSPEPCSPNASAPAFFNSGEREKKQV
ncbi:hypothetical protein GUJ93_ZPchr0004g38440 [Zizania palustris]|uniref:Uncharacterized protein n=1 Tax=Zizania palustris TaxID=103762 RepID=A0A8J5S0Q4_ZIZPA|nr:hypothetical protein GUJ93_ZPchr0004g38440 [Zizania palustris]